MFGVGRNGLDDGAFEKLTVDAAVFEVDGAEPLFRVAVAGVDKIERGFGAGLVG